MYRGKARHLRVAVPAEKVDQKARQISQLAASSKLFRTAVAGRWPCQP